MKDFTDKELLYFYKKVLLDWEKRSNNRFFVKDRSLQLFLKNNSIDLFPYKGKELIHDDNLPKKYLSGYLKFKMYPHGGQVYSILRRLRNSIAHGNFHKKKIGRHYYTIFKDYETSKERRLTLVAKLPHRRAVNFIEILKSTKR